ncbi:hypothetical protein ACWCXX_32370 [Streptomyces sp. NPDC001732]
MTSVLAVFLTAVVVLFSVSHVWAKVRSLLSSVAVLVGTALFLYVLLAAVFHDSAGIEIVFGGSVKSAGAGHMVVRVIEPAAGEQQ